MDFKTPDTNYGNDIEIHVKADKQTRRTYLKFDLSVVPGTTVTSAKLYLYCTAASPSNPLQVNVHETGDSWSEGNITWSNAPTVGALAASNTQVNGTGQYYYWDITSYAQSQHGGDKILSVVVKFPLDDPSQDNPNYHRDFASKEYSGNSCDPYLEITYTEQAPVASFTYSPIYPASNETVTFNASSSYDPDGTIVSYDWDFGDGTNEPGMITTHNYTSVATYNVTLTVTDNDGLTDSTTASVTVNGNKLIWFSFEDADGYPIAGVAVTIYSDNSTTDPNQTYNPIPSQYVEDRVARVYQNPFYSDSSGMAGADIRNDQPSGVKYSESYVYLTFNIADGPTVDWPFSLTGEGVSGGVNVTDPFGKIKPGAIVTSTTSPTGFALKLDEQTLTKSEYAVVQLVAPVNTPPVLDPIGDKTVDELTTLSFTATATDPDAPPQTLTFSLGPGAPAGASITSGGAFTWTPTEAQGPGSYVIRVIVSDGIDQDYEDVTVTVNEVNVAPVLDPIGPKSVNEETTLSFTATATDADIPAQTLIFSLGPSAPPGASITSDGYFTWTPTEDQGPDVYNINITVSDSIDIDYEVIEVTVYEANVAPVLDPIGDKTVDELTTLSFTATASDADLPPQTLTFSLGVGAPSGATISSGGAFSWTPTEAQGPGSYIIRIIVSDGIDQDYEDITVTVNEVNLPPVLDPIGDKTVDEETLLQFTVTASDPDIPAQTLTYSASNLPPGATFDPDTQVFSWTPTSGQAGVYPNVHFEVTDGYLTDSEDITITVTAPPPTYTLTISSTAVGGTTDPPPDTYPYTEGTVVSVTAIPDVGYVFDHWELDGINVGSANPIDVIVDADQTLYAVFVTAQPPAVGGYAAPINIDIDKSTSNLLASQIGLAFALLAAMAATILLTRRRSKTLK